MCERDFSVFENRGIYTSIHQYSLVYNYINIALINLQSTHIVSLLISAPNNVSFMTFDYVFDEISSGESKSDFTESICLYIHVIYIPILENSSFMYL